MANLVDLLQGPASATLHVSELRSDLKEVRRELDDVRRDLQHRIDALVERVHGLELKVESLSGTQATSRETIRAEIALAIAELRIRYA